jgi:D-inositol-3-phosphate glycosyltransferase
MNILIITHYFWPHIGGIEVAAYNQAKELVKKGHKVTIVTSKLAHEQAVDQKGGIRIVRVSAWNVFENKFAIPYPLFSPRLVSTLKKEIERNDVIHAHGALYLGSFVSSLFARIYNKPFFLTEHVGFVMYKNPVINAIEKLALYTMGLATISACDAAIVYNSSVLKWIRRYKKDVHYLPNGVDFALFHKPTEKVKRMIRERYRIPLNAYVVLFVGRFVPKKGFDVLYNAKDPSYLLVFVGEGMMATHLPSDDSVRIVGQLPQEDVAMFYKASDVFILPSYGEGFPLAIQEAMASGLPIITSTYNNLDQILDSPLIIFIDVTEEDLKFAIKKVQNNSKLQQEMSDYSSKTAREHYSWEQNISKLIAMYDEKLRVSRSGVKR